MTLMFSFSEILVEVITSTTCPLGVCEEWGKSFIFLGVTPRSPHFVHSRTSRVFSYELSQEEST